MSKSKLYSEHYRSRDFHKSMYTNWYICPWSMHRTFFNGYEIHPSLAMVMGTINHEFHANIFTWIDEKAMWDSTTFKEAYDYLIQFIPPDAPAIVKNGMIKIVEKESMRWVEIYNKSNEPFFWWKPYEVEASHYRREFVDKTYGDYAMVGTIDAIFRHFPYEKQLELWEWKAKINATRVRRELSFYYTMTQPILSDLGLKVSYWGGFGYNDGEMLYEPVKSASLTAFGKAWPKFLADVNKGMKGEELIKKPKFQSAFSGFIPPICTYCQYQEISYGDWTKEY